MKKLIGIVGVTVIAMAMFFSTNAVNSSNENLDLASISTINTANAENTFPFQIGTKNCVCKGTTCQDAGWVSFRKYCGYGENSDEVCSQWNYKCERLNG